MGLVQHVIKHHVLNMAGCRFLYCSVTLVLLLHIIILLDSFISPPWSSKDDIKPILQFRNPLCYNSPKRSKCTNHLSNGHIVPPSCRHKIGLRLLKVSLAAFHLLLMAGDISINPGPFNSPSHTLPELQDMLSTKGLSILHQNIRGLLANKGNVCRVLDDFHKIQILSLSETHLSTNDEPQAQIDGYSFISKPRKSAKGGGVGAYISSSVTYHRRLDLELDDIECLWIEVLFPKSKGFPIGFIRAPGFIYRPPDSSKHLSKNFNCKLESMLTNISLENKECI